MNKTPIQLDSIDSLIEQFGCFLVDQFGVLHNGFTPYQGAADALRKIKAAGHRVVIISNSGKRAANNVERMNSLGFDDSCFDRLVTSGEVAWHLLQSKRIGENVPDGASCFFLSNNNDRSAVEGLNLTEVENVEKAEVLLLSGQHLDQAGLHRLYDTLSVAIDRQVPCICTNPDKIAYAKSGKVFSSGTVAEWYEEQGGEVIWLGKPYSEIYEHILAMEDISNKEQVVCVGDSVEHDIVGGCRQGMQTVLVRTGINDHLTDDQLEEIFVKHRCEPTFVIDEFSA